MIEFDIVPLLTRAFSLSSRRYQVPLILEMIFGKL
jgi:hypothetical protein